MLNVIDVLNKKKTQWKLNFKYILWKQALIFYAVLLFKYIHLFPRIFRYFKQESSLKMICTLHFPQITGRFTVWRITLEWHLLSRITRSFDTHIDTHTQFHTVRHSVIYTHTCTSTPILLKVSNAKQQRFWGHRTNSPLWNPVG